MATSCTVRLPTSSPEIIRPGRIRTICAGCASTATARSTLPTRSRRRSALLLRRAFDPYPYILLNLVLSCLAALQAPIIMMSQNRQEARDRLRAEHDYKVNLKAELEVRQLHWKLDQLLQHQWQRLLEIQKIQTDLMEELAHRPARPVDRHDDPAQARRDGAGAPPSA